MTKAAHSSRALVPTANPGLHPGWNQTEHRTFDHFYQIAVPELEEYFDSEFFSQYVPQLGTTEPAVQHALMALGACHKRTHLIRWNKGQSIGHYENAIQKFSFQQYSQAIQHLDRVITDKGQRATGIALICCVIFMCLENISGNYTAALTHAFNGLKIYAGWRQTITKGAMGGSTHSSFEGSVCELFIRVANYLLLFHGDHTPSSTITMISRDVVITDTKPITLLDQQSRFLRARNETYGLHMRLMQIVDNDKYQAMPVDQIPSEVWEERSLALTALRQWAIEVDKSLQLDEGQTDTKIARSVVILKMRNLVQLARLTQWPRERETWGTCDDQINEFYQELLTLATTLFSTKNTVPTMNHGPQTVIEKENGISEDDLQFLVPIGIPTFTIESGMIPSLYYVAMSSSSVPICRAAIALLRLSNSREGFFSSVSAANVSQRRLDDLVAGKRYPVGISASQTRISMWETVIKEEMQRYSADHDT